MLPTIIFFLALWFTLRVISGFINDDNDTYAKATAASLIQLICCILWSYLFYLLH